MGGPGFEDNQDARDRRLQVLEVNPDSVTAAREDGAWAHGHGEGAESWREVKRSRVSRTFILAQHVEYLLSAGLAFSGTKRLLGRGNEHFAAGWHA